MRLNLNRVGGAFAAVALAATGAMALDIDPTVVTRASSSADGLWVPVEASGEVVRIDAATGEPTVRVGVAEPGSRLEVDESVDELVVVDRSSGDVHRIDRALHRIETTSTTGVADAAHLDVGGPGVVLARGTEVVLVDADLSSTVALTAPDEITSLVSTDDGVVVATGAEVVRLGADGATRVEFEEENVSLVRIGDDVAFSDGDAVERLGGGDRTCLDSAPGPDAEWAGQPSGLIAVADGAAGVVQIVDLDGGTCASLKISEAGSVLGRPALALGVIFVPEPARGRVHIIDPTAQESRSSVAVARAGTRLQMHVRDGLVVAHDPVSSDGAVLDADGLVMRLSTRESDDPLQAQLGDSGPTAVAGGGDEAPGVESGGVTGVETASSGADADPSVQAEVVDPGADEGVVDDLVANFAFSTDVALVGEMVRFVDESSGAPTSWTWDFGDGSGGIGPTVEKSWDTPGTFTVTLFIERDGHSADVSLPIVVVTPEVELAPSADFTFSSSKVSVGDVVEFEDRSTGQVEQRRWEFGDGTTAEEASPSKSWDTPGSYTVTLTVANELGNDDAKVVIDVVLDLQPPRALITSAPRQAEAGERVDLVGRSTGGPAELEWSFGDGSFGVGARVSHTYGAPGTYTVRLTARNEVGASADTATVRVSEPTIAPVARIAVPPEIIEVGDAVAFTSLTLNRPDTETWSFGDGSSATGAVVEHAWSTPGDFVVTLTATNGAGTSTATQAVTVLPELGAPVAAFTVVPEGGTPNPVAGQYAELVDGSMNATSWRWSVDGVLVAEGSQNHRQLFSGPGVHTVTLDVSNRNGTDSLSVDVTVLPPLVALFFAPASPPSAGSPATFTNASSGATSWRWTVDGALVSTDPVADLTHTFAAPGSYSIALTVANANGSAVHAESVVVDPAPPVVGGVGVGPAGPETGEIVVFAPLGAPTSGPIASWTANFGDGSAPVTAVAPLVPPGPFMGHTYTTAGTYTATFTANGPAASSAPFPVAVTIVDPPPPRIQISAGAVVPSTPVVGESVTITASVLPSSGPIESWYWTVDGFVVPGANAQSLVTSFATSGLHFVQAYAVGPTTEGSAALPGGLNVLPPPPPVISGMSAAPAIGTTGSPVTFTPASTGGAVTSWAWTIDGVPVPGATSSALAHTFATAGSFSVQVTATGPGDPASSFSITYVVHDPPLPSTPVPSIAVPLAGQTVSFTSGLLPGSGPAASWAWQVGGVGAGTGPTLNHTFPAAGTYTVTVIATGPSGAQGTASLVEFVVDAVPPVAGFSPASVGGFDIAFTNTSSGDITSYLWAFGDGTTSTAASPVHTYPAAGPYSVTLTVTGPGGVSVAGPTVVTVPAPPA